MAIDVQNEISSQSEDKLNILLEMMACPMDQLTPLTPIRSSEGEILALKSKSNQYPVNNNIPGMIPDWDKFETQRLADWQIHQDAMWSDYIKGNREIFPSTDDSLLADRVGEIINDTGDGLFLDVGCGVLPQPEYMKATFSKISWVGIDPYLGNKQRDFPFAQALGEYPPFRQNIFDGILYATTLEYMLNAGMSVRKAQKLLKPYGKLYLWTVLAKDEPLKSTNHASKDQPIFSHQGIENLLKDSGFKNIQLIYLCERCLNFPFCNHRDEYMFLATST